MKQILRNISLLSISLMVSIGAVKAQETILKQDGANNEFVVSQWDMGTCGFCFATPPLVTIAKNEAGILAISNTAKYKNIKVELRFDHPLNNVTFTFDLAVQDPNASLTETGVYADATTTNQYCDAIINYNNTSGFEINKMKLSNPSENVKISYIKITGTKVTTSLASEETNTFDVSISPEQLIIDSEMDGTLHIYNALGQVEGSYDITKGENTISNSTQGLMFLVLSDSNTKMVSRKKIMR